MKKQKKSPDENDLAPLPKKRIRVTEVEFDKVIAQFLKSSPIGIYEIKPSGKRRPKRQP